MMTAAKRHRELIADLAAERPRLHEAQTVGAGRAAAPLRLLDFVGRDSRIDQQEQRRFVARLLVEDLLSEVSRLRQLTKRARSLAELELEFQFLRLQFRGLLGQRIRLKQLALIKVDDPSWRRATWSVGIRRRTSR